ncbi:hypothetical protein P278_28340 [Zhouia amylolytica AD3]|uniref:Uncharacterized protein n=1 Tax=Zhouia amylolytica AD3 TaxID=1286632 RepID=W2UIM8_9FLAO|nr:hypothetical protein P278_28340 [Zhouia amylolytica AD3]
MRNNAKIPDIFHLYNLVAASFQCLVYTNNPVVFNFIN